MAKSKTSSEANWIFPCVQCNESGILNNKAIPYNQPCPYCGGKGYISWNELVKMGERLTKEN